jgi:hypothetical protein
MASLSERISSLATAVGLQIKSVKADYLPYTGATKDLNVGLNNLIVDTNTLYVDKINHRIGSGTTSPTYRIDARGTAAADGIRSAMGFDVYQVPDPTAPTGVVSAGGSVNVGNHQYTVVFVTAFGYTHMSSTSPTVTTTSGNQTVTLTIPTSTDPRVTGRLIYRNTIATGWSMQLLATINDNTTTTYIDTVADSALGTYRSNELINSTSEILTINGTKAVTIDRYATYLGYLAGNVSVGTNNTFIGVEVGKVSTTGSSNTGIGRSVLIANTSGNYNTGTGYEALKSNTTGEYNSAYGMRALNSHTTGWLNTAIGYAAGYNLTNGTYNTIVGAYAGYAMTTNAHYNVIVGYESARYQADGSTALTDPENSIYIGRQTRGFSNADNNSIVVGYAAIGKGANTAVWGNTSILAHYFSGQLVYNPQSSAPSSPVEGAIYYNSTDKHFYGYNATTWKQLDN